jgi:hypothetical protein
MMTNSPLFVNDNAQVGPGGQGCLKTRATDDLLTISALTGPETIAPEKRRGCEKCRTFPGRGSQKMARGEQSESRGEVSLMIEPWQGRGMRIEMKDLRRARRDPPLTDCQWRLTNWQNIHSIQLISSGIHWAFAVSGTGMPRALEKAPEEHPMEMLLMGLCITVFSLAVTALAFGAATRSENSARPVQPEVKPALKPSPGRFFADELATPVQGRPRVPIEALLLQIERHVRLEHAAAESFLESPDSVVLYSKTASPFVN